MGNWNANVPTVLGLEYQPAVATLLGLDSGQAGVACRFRNTGTPTISHVHLPVEAVQGNPGLAVEIVDTLTPTIGYTDYYAGTDTGSTVTGFTDQGAAAANYSEIDDRADGTDYHTNTAALASGRYLSNLHRGNNAGAFSGKRILRVDVGATVHLRRGVTGNGAQVPLVAQVVIDATTYSSPVRQQASTQLPATIDTLGSWDLNPSTGIPWTAAEVDDIVDAADADTFGLKVGGRLAASGFRLIGKWLRVWTCTENRKGYYYAGGQPTVGWVEYPLSGTAALVNNTSYYLTVAPLLGTTANLLRLRRIEDPNAILDTSASGTGEHRQAYDLRLFSRGGAATTATAKTGMLPFLLDASTTIQASSQPYQISTAITVNRSSQANIGQQFTTDASTTTYGGCWITIGWENAQKRPDQPLKLQLQSGAGAISGSGTIRATAYLDPEASVPGPTRVLVPFATAYTTAAATQYHLLVSSAATFGWKVYVADTGSQTIGSGTTVNEIEKATFGPAASDGQTDSYVIAGTAYDRYDLGAALFASPTPPANLTATITSGSTTQRPKVLLDWDATSLTTAFDSYRVYRRPSRGAARPWVLIGELDVPDGYTAAIVEAQHTAFIDRSAGWSAEGGPYVDGWDYAVTVKHATSGLESTSGVASVVRQAVPAPAATWLVCNDAPWLDTPLGRVHQVDSSTDDDIDVYRPAGRDFAVTRRRAEDPPRQWGISWRTASGGDATGSAARSVSTSGRQVTVLTPRGDRIEGSLGPAKISQGADPVLDGDATLIETAREPAVAGYNLPAGVVLDGSADYLTVTDANDLDPVSSGFTVICCGAFADTANAKILSKGNLGTSDGYGLIRNGANSVQFYVDGATTAGGPAYTSASWFDGTVRVAAGSSSGTAQSLYLDGASVATSSVTHGSVSNAVALVAGANNGGASQWMAVAPLHAFAFYLRVLTAAEHLSAANYLLGVPGAVMPTGAVLFVDLRDSRCWDGISTSFTDLSGYGHEVSAVSAPPTRGVPWPLGDLDRWS